MLKRARWVGATRTRRRSAGPALASWARAVARPQRRPCGHGRLPLHCKTKREDLSIVSAGVYTLTRILSLLIMKAEWTVIWEISNFSAPICIGLTLRCSKTTCTPCFPFVCVYFSLFCCLGDKHSCHVCLIKKKDLFELWSTTSLQ